MVRFYTLPPVEIPYPYVLINANNPGNGLRYIIRNRGFIESVIIDSGVEIFRNPAIKDYPSGHVEKLVNLYKRVKSIVSDGEVYVTVPDYPDDYNPKSLWINGKTNIERTLDNILYALNSYSEVKWLIPVQGHYRSPKSIIYALELYQRHDVPLNDYIAIANLCVEDRVMIVNETVRLAWNWLWRNGYYNTRIHVFGPDTRSIYEIGKYIYSYDSMAWTRPRGSHGWSAKSASERAYLFITYLVKHSRIIDLPSLPLTMRRRRMDNLLI